MSEPIEVVIEASKWARGPVDVDEPEKSTRLCNDNGTMCCLGFDAVTCGMEPKRAAYPSELAWDYNGEVDEDSPGWRYSRPWVESYDGDRSVGLEDAAVLANDRAGLTPDERIELLRPIFAAAGRKLVWRPDL